ncbi:MAG: type II toxin-antitoxin system HicB family antitoxin [Planctomycetes bacterium]|nr:type II toxin-antitoxin system HicB family antitoxin [Planctomycetota bacterium]
MPDRTFTAVVEKEEGGWVALCPELDVASQGDSVQSALDNLREAVALFLECADPLEVTRRTRTDVFVTRFDVPGG